MTDDRTTDEPTADDGVSDERSTPAREPSNGAGPSSDAGLSNGDGPASAGLILSERRTDEGLLVAICDDDVLGESFEEGEISLTVTEEFYGGDLVDDAAALASLRRAAVANLVGERTVGLAIEAGIVEEANVLDVDGTRHAQVLSLR